MVGYAENHSNDTYVMYNPKTNKTLMSRDVTWADFHRPKPTDDMAIFTNRELKS